MKKFLHQAGGIARKVTAAAVELRQERYEEKLAHMAAEAAVSAVAAVGKAATKLLGKAACGVGKRVQKIIPPFCKVMMIVSGAVAVLSCVGWLISRKKFA